MTSNLVIDRINLATGDATREEVYINEYKKSTAIYILKPNYSMSYMLKSKSVAKENDCDIEKNFDEYCIKQTNSFIRGITLEISENSIGKLDLQKYLHKELQILEKDKDVTISNKENEFVFQTSIKKCQIQCLPERGKYRRCLPRKQTGVLELTRGFRKP